MKLDPASQALLSHILQQSKELGRLVASLSDYAQMQSGQFKVFCVGGSIHYMVSDAVESMLAWAKSRNIILESQVEMGLPQVMADPRRTAGVIRELIANALCNMDSGGRVSVRVRKGEGEQDGFLVFSVEDTGRGVPAAEIKKIIQEFTKASQDSNGGLGLGLAMAAEIIRLQKGKLWVEPVEPRGLAVRFTLPIFIPPPDYKPPEAAQTVQKIQEKPWWRRLLGL